MRRSTIQCERAARRIGFSQPVLPSNPASNQRSFTNQRPSVLAPFSFQTRPSYICHRCLSNSTHRFQTVTSASSQEQQPPASSRPRSAYDLFPTSLSSGPPPSGSFDIDASSLRREFLQLQASAHPDRHADPTMKHKAEATSAALNDAYRTLLDPLQRARHILLVQRGIDLEGDEASKEEDQELLMSVLEAREVIEEAEEEVQLEPLRAENDQRIQESEQILSNMFGGEDWEGAKREAIRLRYWMNIRDSIKSWEKGKPVVLVH